MCATFDPDGPVRDSVAVDCHGIARIFGLDRSSAAGGAGGPAPPLWRAGDHHDRLCRYRRVGRRRSTHDSDFSEGRFARMIGHARLLQRLDDMAIFIESELRSLLGAGSPVILSTRSDLAAERWQIYERRAKPESCATRRSSGGAVAKDPPDRSWCGHPARRGRVGCMPQRSPPAAGGERWHRPAYFLETQQARDLVRLFHATNPEIAGIPSIEKIKSKQ